MIKPAYTPVQLGLLLHRTLKDFKKEMSKPVVPSIKDVWKKESSLKMLDTLEMELKKLKKDHPNIRVTINDIRETIGMALDVFLKELDVKKE